LKAYDPIATVDFSNPGEFGYVQVSCVTKFHELSIQMMTVND
jgi:hypothetical protein